MTSAPQNAASTLESLNTPYMYRLLRSYQADIAQFSLQFLRGYSVLPGQQLNSFLVESAYNVRAFQRAYEFLWMLREKQKGCVLDVLEDQQTLNQLEQDIRQRLREQTSGWYDFQSLFDSVNGSPFPRLEAGDYRSPKLQVKTEAAFGVQRLHTLQNIVPGELLLMEKTLLYSNETDYSNAIEDLAEQFRKLILPFQALEDDPAVCRILEIGGEENTAKCSETGFSPLTALTIKQAEIEDSIWPLYNYQVQNRTFNVLTQNQNFGYAVCPRLFQIKNSCTPNCSVSFLGDFLVVVATAPIPASAEISVNKFSPYNQACFKELYEIAQFDRCECRVCRSLTRADMKGLAAAEQPIRNRIRRGIELAREGAFAKEDCSVLCDEIAAFEQRAKLPRSLRAFCAGLYADFITLLHVTKQPFVGRRFCLRLLELFGMSLEPEKEKAESGKKDSSEAAIGPHEALLFPLHRLIGFDQMIIERGLDAPAAAQYTAEITSLEQIAAEQSRLLLGWEEIGGWKYG